MFYTIHIILNVHIFMSHKKATRLNDPCCRVYNKEKQLLLSLINASEFRYYLCDNNSLKLLLVQQIFR